MVFTFQPTAHRPLNHTLSRNDGDVRLRLKWLQRDFFSCWPDVDEGYHEANFLNDFLVLLLLVGQQPLG